MKYTVKTIFLLLFLTTNWAFAQTDSDKVAAKLERGQEIINQARKAFDKGNVLQNLKSFYLNVGNTISGNITTETEFSIVTPDKIRFVYISEPSRTIKIINGSKYSEDSELSVNGETYSERKMGRPPLPTKIPSYIEEVLSKEKVEYLKKNSDELNKLLMEESLWTNVFPILLTNPLNTDVKYEYVGKAESADKRADIIDVKSNFYRKIRLFFDENTHLLLMMTRTLDRSKSTFTEKYYFSDYQLTDGLLVAKTIKKESENVSKDGSGRKTYGPSQTVIKEIKINSNLKPSLFAF